MLTHSFNIFRFMLLAPPKVIKSEVHKESNNKKGPFIREKKDWLDFKFQGPYKRRGLWEGIKLCGCTCRGYSRQHFLYWQVARYRIKTLLLGPTPPNKGAPIGFLSAARWYASVRSFGWAVRRHWLRMNNFIVFTLCVVQLCYKQRVM